MLAMRELDTIAPSHRHPLEVMDTGYSARQPTVTPESTDLELFQAMQVGQVEGLRLLYRRYGRLVYSFALNVLGNAEEAEDLTQEIFLKCWSQNTYQPERGSLSRYLMLLTRSRAIDRLRSRASRQKNLQRWHHMTAHETASDSPLEYVSLEERSHQVRHALTTLSAAEREVLELAYYQGLSQSEMAQQLNIPLGTVKTRSRQALKKLRQTLQDTL